jgi:O-methyltransferase
MRIIGFLKNIYYNCSLIGFFLKFIFNTAGREYGISYLQKLTLLRKVRKNHKIVKSLSSYHQHLVMISDIFQIPKALRGDVVECGCYNGASSINLSLACALTNRRLFICDSFEGLPKPRDDEKYDINPHSTDYYVWEEGEFGSEGGVEEVKKNIAQYGNIDACIFVKGYFNETLKKIDTDSIVLIFEDADIVSSVEDCLRYLWPKLIDGCLFYSHEAWSMQVVALFFDQAWWRDNLNTQPPGFYGSGFGAPGKFGLGYAQKFDPEKTKEQGKKIVHAGSIGFNGDNKH